MYDGLFAYLCKKDVKYKRSIKLSTMSSVRIGGVLDVAVFPNTIEKLVDVLRYLYKNEYRFFVLGKMTNTLADDSEYNGVGVFTVHLNHCSSFGDLFCAECGVVLSGMILRLAQRSLGGMESLFGIPGTVGGMVYSNAGAYENETSDFLVSATVYDIRTDMTFALSKADLGFSYRSSIFAQNKYLILLDASFLMCSKCEEEVKERINSIMAKRKSSQPLEFPSLGSVFKRSGDVPIAKLIDSCGLKGIRIGNAEISDKHAGFIINKGGATSAEYKSLVEMIKEKLQAMYRISPKEEIEYLKFLP